LTVGIRLTSGGHPTGGDLCSGTINGNTLTDDSAGEWYEITLSSYNLTADTKYAIVCRALTGGMFNEVDWRCSGPGTPLSPYSRGNGEESVNSGSSWTDTGLDLMFEEWGTAILSPRETKPVEDKVTLQLIREVEMSAGGGRFYIDKEGKARYESRFGRNPE
jgi:hypothetical protein